MRCFQSVLAFLVAVLAATAARAEVQVEIDLGAQRMHVTSSSGSYTWPVSTARAGYSTPRGSYAPTGMQRMHYSRKYDMTPMPHSIFFRGGYAIHGSYAIRSLGRPASHGCVRLAPANAAQLFAMVKAEGARISITGSPPRTTRYASLRRHRTQVMAYAPARRYRPASVRAWQAFPFGAWW
jgi:lipoprotein-anchoring transpeptidase ErfK/SrfK